MGDGLAALGLELLPDLALLGEERLASLAVDAIRDVGAGGHFFGAAHTMSRYETAFYSPLLSNWDNHTTFLDRGGVQARERANTIWKCRASAQ